MAAAVFGMGLLAGCATPPTDDPDALAAYEEANDPLEPMNRYFFELNYAADELLFKPLAGWYYVALPDFAQDGVRNALRNLRSPIVLANDLFQGETERAGITVGRFLVNSTLGLAGLFDVASEMGLEYHDEDFGQTMAVHGVEEGPYLVLPLLGPSNPRDAGGRVVDMLFDPLTYIGIFAVDNIGLGAAVLEGVDTRARNLKTLDEVRKGSLDYYATLRSLYRQRRNDEINNGRAPPEGVGPSFDIAPEDETSERPAPPQVSAAAPFAAASSPTYVIVPVVDAPAPAAGPRIASSTFIKEPTGPVPAALAP
jgi:phospholipid-binding lipoprotein MlaA